jgi:glycine oxidase
MTGAEAPTPATPTDATTAHPRAATPQPTTANPSVATADVATADVATADVATADVATADVATADVVIAGGGVIGLACAWSLARRGRRVILVDPAPGSGASRVAAGMLAPATEAHYGEERLLRLTLAAAAMYPEFVADLEAATGREVGYRRCGTLSIALDNGDRAALGDLAEFQARLGLEVTVLSGREARQLEPGLAPGIRAGLLAPNDHQVDSRRLLAGLLAGARAAGVDGRAQRVDGLLVSGERVTGLRVSNPDGSGGAGRIEAAWTVVALGAHSGRLAGLPPGLVPVRPVKGQLLRLAAAPDGPILEHTVRALVGGRQVYVVPRTSGEVVVGATVEEMGFDTTVRAGAVADLLDDAQAVLPGIRELELTEVNAGLRPGTPDNAPLIGPAGPDGLLLATGGYRNGVLLAPLTAAIVTGIVEGGPLPAAADDCLADRFTSAAVPA